MEMIYGSRDANCQKFSYWLQNIFQYFAQVKLLTQRPCPTFSNALFIKGRSALPSPGQYPDIMSSQRALITSTPSAISSIQDQYLLAHQVPTLQSQQHHQVKPFTCVRSYFVESTIFNLKWSDKAGEESITLKFNHCYADTTSIFIARTESNLWRLQLMMNGAFPAFWPVNVANKAMKFCFLMFVSSKS